MSSLSDLISEARELRHYARNQGMSDAEIDECIEHVLSGYSSIHSRECEQRKCKLVFTILLTVVLISLPLYVVVACHKPTQTFFSRNIQDFIYPFMRYLRLSTLALHNRFPSITSWHEEQCLIKNPMYRNPDVGCWPCEQVKAVTNLTEFESFARSYYQNGTPFIVKESSTNQILPLLEKVYSDNKKPLDKGTGFFHSNIPSLRKPGDVFEPGKSYKLLEYSKLHIEWQFRRAPAARVLRTVFPRPYFVPNTSEVALERYLFIDGPSAPLYSLPLTEFANVWLSQKLGRRIVTLQPSPYCQSSCITISTVLSKGDILFYNWQFWRPQFLPSSTSLSITYMGSFY